MTGELAEERTLPGVEDPVWLRAMELGTLGCLPMALKAAINLNVMGILSKQTHMLSAAQIVSRLPPCSNPQAATTLDRILRALASHGILSSSADNMSAGSQPVRTYGLNDVSKFFVKNEDGASLGPIVVMSQDKVFMDAWQYLDEAVLYGINPFARAHGEDLFSYMSKVDPDLGKLFHSTMASHTQLFIPLLLDSYSGFGTVSTLVDVGGGLGACLRMIVSKHPHIQGINFDQPHVIAAAPEYPGMKNVGGDMFFSIPKADAIFLKWILHDWNDEQCVKILKNCYEALPEKGGKLIIVDTLVPPVAAAEVENETLRARVCYHVDLLMLSHNPGGQERTHLELLELSKAASFTGMQVVSKLNETSVVELYKA